MRPAAQEIAKVHQPPAGRPLRQNAGGADVLTLGFGTTAAMWAIGFLGRLPGVELPSPYVFLLMLAVLLAGGVLAGRNTGRGVRGGIYAGLIVGLLNLMILGGLLAQAGSGERAIEWLAGSLVIAMVVAGIGAAWGSKWRPALGASTLNWRALFAFVAACATLLLVIVGGSVTGTDSGLAVVDWPNTEGWFMCLYPLARMSGGIYFEHSHRLIGTLVGLTTLTLAIFLQLTEPRRRVRRFAWFLVAMVIVQGILGGLRVTGHFTLSTDPHDTTPNIVLAIVHGMLAQVFFACLIATAVFLSRTWEARIGAQPAPAAGTDRKLAAVLIGLLLLQLALGALVRHLSWSLSYLPSGLDVPPDQLMRRGTWALHLHITLAVIIVIIGIVSGFRAWGVYSISGLHRRLGMALVVCLSLQLLMGIIALLAVGNDSIASPPTAWDTLVTTAHQTLGAVLLGLGVALAVCNYRLLVPAQPAST